MMQDSVHRSLSAPGNMAREFRRAQAQLRDMGLTLSVWDHFGELVEDFEPTCELCKLLGQTQACCEETRKVAQHVVFGDRAIVRRSQLGACIIGVPVHERRRLVAAAVACFPVTEMLEGEQLHRMCDHLHLDYEIVAGHTSEMCRYSLNDAEHLIGQLSTVLDRERTLRVAQDELVGLSANLASTYEELSLVYRISGTMKLTREPDVFLREDVCEELLEVMNVQYTAAIIYASSSGGQADRVISAGDLELTGDQIQQLAALEVAPQFADGAKSVVENHFVGGSRKNTPDAVDRLIAVPLIGDGKSMGMLLAINKTDQEFDSVDVKLLNAIGNQTAVFLTNRQLYADMQDLLMGVLESLTASIDAKDPYTCGHSLRVARISERLAELMDYSPEESRQIYLAGLLHDVGKIGVPESVLCKPGKLTDEEFEHIKRHPSIASRILGGIRQLDDVAVGILTHHERLDGKGYPQGLTGKDMPIEGRIIGLADCFDAMTSDRCYRAALPLSAVIEEIRKHSGTQFDPELVAKFLTLDLEEFLVELRHDDVKFKPRNDQQEEQ